MADRVAQLLMEQGRNLAEGHRRGGEIWGNTVRDVGFTFANLAQQYPQMRAQEAEKKRAALEDQQLRTLFDSGQVPTPDAIIRVVGPERGMRIAAGLSALQTDPQGDFQKTQTILRDVLLGMDSLPESLRAENYPGVRQSLIQRRVIKPEDAPEAYDPAFWERTIKFGQQPAKAEGFTLSEGQTRFGPAGQPVANVAKPAATVKKTPITLRGPQGQPVGAFAGDDGKYYSPRGEVIDNPVMWREPKEGKTPSFLTLVGPKGEQRRVADGDEVNRLLAQGWKQYDATAVRNEPDKATLLNTQTRRAQDGLDIIKDLIEFDDKGNVTKRHPGLNRAFGAWQGALPDVDQDSVSVRERVKRLSSLVTLPEMQSLRGLGPASDRDVKIVENGASMLMNARISDADAVSELKRIREAFTRLLEAGRAAGVVPGAGTETVNPSGALPGMSYQDYLARRRPK